MKRTKAVRQYTLSGNGFSETVEADSAHHAAIQARTGTLGSDISVELLPLWSEETCTWIANGDLCGSYRVHQTMRGPRAYKLTAAH